MSDRMLRFAVVLQTPKDQQSAVYIGYQSLAEGLEHLNHLVTIVAPSDFPRVARLSGRWTPLVYPLALASWLGDRRDKFDLVLFHSYSGWVASLVGRGRPRALVMFHGVEPLYHRALRAEAQRSGRPLTWRYRFLQEVFMPFVLGIACRRAFGVACLNQGEAAYSQAAWLGLRFEPARACAWRPAGIFRVCRALAARFRRCSLSDSGCR